MNEKDRGSYDPAIHHWRSIRMKGHDYAGGGSYFVTISAHKGRAYFRNAAIKEMIGHIWDGLAGRFPEITVRAPFMGAPLNKGCGGEGTHKGCPYIIMPDHFHGIINIRHGANGADLGEIVGAFKSLTTTAYCRGVHENGWPRFDEKIWHRNYYEHIIRDADDFSRISDYIRMNPWKLIMQISSPIGCAGEGAAIKGAEKAAPTRDARTWRGIGNPALFERGNAQGIIISRRCPAAERESILSKIAEQSRDPGAIVISGFHSPAEKACLQIALKGRAGIIHIPACKVTEGYIRAEWLEALEQNRMLILSPFDNPIMNRTAALERNDLVRELASIIF